MTAEQRKYIDEARKKLVAGLLGLESMGKDFQAVNASRKCFEDSQAELDSLIRTLKAKPNPFGLSGGGVP